MHFYHFTSLENYREMLGESPRGKSMTPNLRMIPLSAAPDLPEISHKPAIFGLLEAEPENWWVNDYSVGESVLESILKDIGCFYTLALLKVNIEPEDQVYVADWGVHLRSGFKGRKSEGHIYEETKRAYATSLVPIEEYSLQEAYLLPEVICFSKIPLERIELVDTYKGWPYVNEMRLRHNRSPVEDYLLDDDSAFPALEMNEPF